MIKLALILSLISILSQNFIAPQSNKSSIDLIDASHLSSRVLINRIKRKVRRAASLFEIFLQIHMKSFLSHLWQTLFLSYLILCTPLGSYVLIIAPVLFIALCTRTIFNFLGCLCRCKALSKLVDHYGRCVDFVCKMITMFCLCLIFAQFFQWFLCDVVDCDMLLLIGSIAPSDQQGQWEAKYSCQELLIEENELAYRVSLGRLHWKFYKSNPFDKKVFAVLLAMTQDEQGKASFSTRKLAGALGFTTHDLLNRLVLRCKAEGHTLTTLIGGDRKGYQGKIRDDIVTILQTNVCLSLVEIRDRLIAKGWHEVTIAQIKCAMEKIDFNALHEHIRRQLPMCNVLPVSDDPEIKISRKSDTYRICLGNLHWDIACDNRFDLSSLFYFLISARNQDGRAIVGIKAIGRMLQIKHYQTVQKWIKAIRYIANRYRVLKVTNKRLCNQQHDAELRKIILDIWREDITINGNEIRKRLQAQGEDVSPKKLRDLMRNVDFWSLRLRLAKEYQKGKYRKSTQWVISKQHELIESLILKLKQGQTYSPAQIIQFVEQCPKTIFPQKEQNREIQKDVHWLKCFLFNLPKQMKGKICCPTCGNFNTARKSLVPLEQMITDPRTGVSKSVNTYRFYCKNPDCARTSFTATPDGAHILHEERYAQICLMLRLVFSLRGSYRAVANLLGTSKSVVFDQLTLLSQMPNYWEQILGPPRFSGTLCIDEKYVKIAAFKKTKKHPFGYLIFAVDPLTHDLLHIEIFETRDHQAARTFLLQLKAKGIYPKTIMTDLANTYDKPVRDVFGRSVTMARCFFHFKKNIFDHMDKQFGKKNSPKIAKQLKKEIFDIVDAATRKSIKKRNWALLKKKEQYLTKEPRLLPMFNCLQNYLPHLLRTVESPKVSIRTNNPCEQVIRHFNQRYKIMSGMKTLDTARRHAHLFQIVYRFTPFSQDATESKRGYTPLELAGYHIEHTPLYKYLTQPLLFNTQPAKNLALLLEKVA